MKTDWRRELLVLLAVAAATALLFAPHFVPGAPGTCVLGDARDREAARVPERLRAARFDATAIELGLGAAAISGWQGLGDAVAFGGSVWLRSTDRAAAHYYRLVGGRHFQTNYFVYVPAGTVADARHPLKAAQSLTQLRAALARRHPRGVIAAGYLRFAELRTIAIAAPAIDGRAVRGDATHYYTRPMESARNCWAYVLVMAAALPGAADDEPRARLLPTTSAHGVAYALRLKGPPGDRDRPPATAQLVALGEITADSIVAEGELAVYPITRVADCEAQARTAVSPSR